MSAWMDTHWCIKLCLSRMVKKLEPGLTAEVTIQPSLDPPLDFNHTPPNLVVERVSRSSKAA